MSYMPCDSSSSSPRQKLKPKFNQALYFLRGTTGKFSNTMQKLCRQYSNCMALPAPAGWMVFCTDYLSKTGREIQSMYTMCMNFYKQNSQLCHPSCHHLSLRQQFSSLHQSDEPGEQITLPRQGHSGPEI